MVRKDRADPRRRQPGDTMDRLEAVTEKLEEAVRRLEADLDLDGIPDILEDPPHG